MKNTQDAEKKDVFDAIFGCSVGRRAASSAAFRPFFFKNISTPFLFLCFYPQFFTSFLCALTLERSQKVSYYSLKRKSNCDFDPAAYGGRVEGA